MPARLPYCVYVLRSDKDNHFYIGFTTDLNQRLTAQLPSWHARGTANSVDL